MGLYSNIDFLEEVERARQKRDLEKLEELKEESIIEESFLFQKLPLKRKIRMKKQSKMIDLTHFERSRR